MQTHARFVSISVALMLLASAWAPLVATASAHSYTFAENVPLPTAAPLNSAAKLVPQGGQLQAYVTWSTYSVSIWMRSYGVKTGSPLATAKVLQPGGAVVTLMPSSISAGGSVSTYVALRQYESSGG